MRTRAALVMSRDGSTWKPNGGDYSHSTFPLLFVSNTLPEGAATAILSLLKAGTRTHADWRFTVRARESAAGSRSCARLGYGFRWLASAAERSCLVAPHQVGRTGQYRKSSTATAANTLTSHFYWCHSKCKIGPRCSECVHYTSRAWTHPLDAMCFLSHSWLSSLHFARRNMKLCRKKKASFCQLLLKTYLDI